MKALQYVVIGEAIYPCDTGAHVELAETALSEAGQNSADVWATPHTLEWIVFNGDPDGVKTGSVVLANTDVDPVANGTKADR